MQVTFIVISLNLQVLVCNWENDTFTKDGYVNWKRGLGTLEAHFGGPDSAQNKASKCAADFKNQIQSVVYVCPEKSAEKYKAHLIIVLGTMRYFFASSCFWWT
jgi:hypothetical protein